MIYIHKNQTNKFVLTLSESSTLSSPYFLFQFENEFNQGPDPIYWTAPDESVATNRYNQFTLIDVSSGSTTGGTSSVNLTAGQYTYSVYEATASTLHISATTGSVLETGRMVVILNQSDINNNINSIYF